jgi:hypothetical protein
MNKRRLVALGLLLVPALMIAADVQLPAQTVTQPPKKKKNPGTKKAKNPGKNPAKKQAPPPPKVYLLRPQAPNWVTADLEVRDPAGNLWPNFFYGKPVGTGTFTYDAKSPKGSFTLFYDRRAQRNGHQGRRVLGDLLKANASVTAKLTVTSLAAVRKEDEVITDTQGFRFRRSSEFSPFTGTLELGDQLVDVNGKASYRFTTPPAGGPETVYIDLRFKVKGSDLGLTKIKGNLDWRAGAIGQRK